MRLLLAAILALAVAAPAQALDLRRFDSLLNAQRNHYGLPSLTQNRALMRAAHAHALDVAQRGMVSHVSTNGNRLADRARAAGYCYRTLAENIAWGHDTEVANIRGWMNSSGHRRNILHNGITQYGVGRVGDIWVMVVGRPC